MRFTRYFKKFQSKLVLPMIATAILLVLLAVNPSSTNPTNAGKMINSEDTKVLAEQSEEASSQSTKSSTESQNINSEVDEQSSRSSTNSSFSLSINASSFTTNGETTGSTDISAKINENNLGDVFDECMENGDVKINADRTKVDCEYNDGTLEIDFRSDNRTRTKNKSEFSSKIETKNNHDD
ncbi:MAG: hypothetical protein WD187_01690 [Candidatus Woykebacteria bacterium]